MQLTTLINIQMKIVKKSEHNKNHISQNKR